MQQCAVRVACAVFHPIPGLDHDLQIADCPKLPPTDAYIRGNDLIGTVLLEALLQICSLLTAQFERILPLPVRLQSRHACLLISLCPFPNTAVTALDKLPDFPRGDPAAIQTHGLQASQLVGITGLLFGLLKYSSFFVRQLKLSLCHNPDYTSGGFFFVYPLDILLLVLLRERLDEYEMRDLDGASLVLSEDELVDMIRVFMGDHPDARRVEQNTASSINRLKRYGFLTQRRDGRFEVRSLIRAKISADELNDIKLRLARYIQQNDDTDQDDDDESV
jgi:hypothetical protein